MSNKYSISSYNKDVCLKVNETMLIIFVFMLKPFVIALFSVVNRSDRMQLITMFYPDRGIMSLGAFAGIPVAFLIYAWIKRKPGATSFIRHLWKNGKSLIAASVILNACIILVPALLSTSYKMTISSWAQLLIYMLIIIIVYNSQYIKDCFSDFPENKNP